LPGRVPVPPGLGAFLAGCVESTFGRLGTVIGSIEGRPGALHGGKGIGERILGRSPAGASSAPAGHPGMMISEAEKMRARPIACRSAPAIPAAGQQALATSSGLLL
jgi:hypothetical protein